MRWAGRPPLYLPAPDRIRFSPLTDLPNFGDVTAAARRLKGHARRTPMLCDTALDEHIDGEAFLKCENFQRIGAFKFRGAWNAISQLTEDQRTRGIITHSSGNHGQAVALSGRLLGITTTVVMPMDAPVRKRAATEDHGAMIIDYDPANAKREAISKDLVETHGYTLIPPFDHPHVIAGQGTAALELLDQSGPLDTLLVPCGGGGLLSGNAISTRHLQPACRIIGIEPELADDATRSFRSGTLQRVDNPRTIADGTRTESLGTITFPLIQNLVDDFCTVTEEAIVEAVRFLFHEVKLVVEPSGALGVAALLSGRAPGKGRIGVIISGGNIDGQTIADILNP